MSNEGYPSKNPALEGGMAGTLALVLAKFLQNVDDCLPASVLSYDRKANVAQVRPLIALLSTDGSSLPRAAVASVPVLALGGGGFMVNFPLKAGDLGWIKASDRDISLFMQGMREAKPNTLRKHSFEDGLFIPDVFRRYTLDGEDEGDNMVIQSLDGAVRVALWPDRVKLTSRETWLEVNGDGTITGKAPDHIFFDTPLVKFAGVFQSGVSQGGGTSTMNGGLRTTRDVVAGGVSVAHHTHPGIQPGTGNTDKPTGGA